MKKSNDKTDDVVTILVDEAEIWRMKREGQANSRLLVKNGTRRPEDNFLIPREVARNSKVRYRGLKK